MPGGPDDDDLGPLDDDVEGMGMGTMGMGGNTDNENCGQYEVASACDADGNCHWSDGATGGDGDDGPDVIAEAFCDSMPCEQRDQSACSGYAARSPPRITLAHMCFLDRPFPHFRDLFVQAGFRAFVLAPAFPRPLAGLPPILTAPLPTCPRRLSSFCVWAQGQCAVEEAPGLGSGDTDDTLGNELDDDEEPGDNNGCVAIDSENECSGACAATSTSFWTTCHAISAPCRPAHTPCALFYFVHVTGYLIGC